MGKSYFHIAKFTVAGLLKLLLLPLHSNLHKIVVKIVNYNKSIIVIHFPHKFSPYTFMMQIMFLLEI